MAPAETFLSCDECGRRAVRVHFVPDCGNPSRIELACEHHDPKGACFRLTDAQDLVGIRKNAGALEKLRPDLAKVLPQVQLGREQLSALTPRKSLFRSRPASKELAARRLAAKHELEAYVGFLADADGCISPDAIEKYFSYQAQLDLEPRDAFDCLGALRLGLAKSGTFIRANTALVLGDEEAAVYEAGAALLIEVKDREYRGSEDVGVLPVEGIGSRDRDIRRGLVTVGTHWETADQGRLTITTEQVVYQGKRKTLAFPFTDLATPEVYGDGIGVGVTSRPARSTFRLTNPHVVAGIITAVRKGGSPRVITLPTAKRSLKAAPVPIAR